MKDLLTGWLLYTAILLFLVSAALTLPQRVQPAAAQMEARMEARMEAVAEQAAALLPEAWGRE